MDRRAIAVNGIVQGVGFRPFVYGLATRLRLDGFVKNVNGGVLIEVEGEPHSLDRFLDELTAQPPPLARIDELRWSSRPPRGDPAFRIEPSERDDVSPIFISPDVATCDDCLRRAVRSPRSPLPLSVPQLHQLRPPADDHHRDRPTTASGRRMASFAMCPACRAEYDDPADRRFHAQPTACPACGPRLRLLDASGAADRGDRSARRRRRRLAAGADRRPQGPGRLPPRLRRGRRAGRGRAAQPEAPR